MSPPCNFQNKNIFRVYTVVQPPTVSDHTGCGQGLLNLRSAAADTLPQEETIAAPAIIVTQPTTNHHRHTQVQNNNTASRRCIPSVLSLRTVTPAFWYFEKWCACKSASTLRKFSRFFPPLLAVGRFIKRCGKRLHTIFFFFAKHLQNGQRFLRCLISFYTFHH